MNTEHGRSKYVGDRCRCPVCTEANSTYQVQRREKRALYVATHGLPATVAHGTSAYANWGCRCLVCTEAYRVKNAKYRRRAASKKLMPRQPSPTP